MRLGWDLVQQNADSVRMWAWAGLEISGLDERELGGFEVGRHFEPATSEV